MELRFSGHRALIAGGTCALAVSLARLLARQGIIPILTWRDEKGKRRLITDLGEDGVPFETVFLDFSDRTSVPSLFSRPGNDIDYLVDFAHGDLESLICSSNSDAVREYFAANVACRAALIKEAGRIMLSRKRGRMVFVSSVAADKPNVGQGFYAAAKLASEALYRSLGIELGSRGVTAVTLRPGYIDSGRGKEYIRSHGGNIERAIPIGRALTEYEVADAVFFLLSDNAVGFNATEIVMDGGLTAGK
jgi:3-oxoacyl-[acyl-carrier protein] reductase